MEQLRLLDFDHANALRALPPEIRDEVVCRMAEAIVVIFRVQKGKSHDPCQDPS